MIKEDKAIMLSPAMASKYLKDTPALPISPAPQSVLVPREFLGTTYGALQYTFLSDTTRNFVFPTIDVDPELPQEPGAPGLLFSCRHKMVNGEPWSVFIRVTADTPKLWEYLGEYEHTVAGDMGGEEFECQRPSVSSSPTSSR